jgi:hypothetical protein
MRTTKELLYLVKQTVQEERVNGICSATTFLWLSDTISNEEYYELKSFLQTNLPPRAFKGAYCWKPYEKEPRIRWLDQQILLLESYGSDKKV